MPGLRDALRACKASATPAFPHPSRPCCRFPVFSRGRRHRPALQLPRRVSLFGLSACLSWWCCPATFRASWCAASPLGHPSILTLDLTPFSCSTCSTCCCRVVSGEVGVHNLYAGTTGIVPVGGCSNGPQCLWVLVGTQLAPSCPASPCFPCFS